MKNFILTGSMLLITSITFAQYGKLQPIKPGDTVMVLRTPAPVLEKISTDKSSTVRRNAGLIEQVEDELEIERKRYLKRDTTLRPNEYIGHLSGMIGELQRAKFADVNYYIKEFLLYNPRN